MAIKLSNLYLAGAAALAYPAFAGQLVVQRATFSVAAAGENAVAANDIIDMMPIPHGLVPLWHKLIADDLDSDGTPAITFDMGIMTGTPGDDVSARTIGAEWFSASTLAQAGGIAESTLKTAWRIASSNEDRSIGIKIATAADALQAGVFDLWMGFATP